MAKKVPAVPPTALEESFGLAAGQGDELTRRWRTLTPREAEVVALMVTGKKNRQIAAELGIAIKTLDIHRGNVVRKLGMPPVGLGRVYFYLKQAGMPEPEGAHGADEYE